AQRVNRLSPSTRTRSIRVLDSLELPGAFMGTSNPMVADGSGEVKQTPCRRLIGRGGRSYHLQPLATGFDKPRCGGYGVIATVNGHHFGSVATHPIEHFLGPLQK